ncbi:hypothetical protein EUGRSUZ_F04262 [Eucalyptus grandis]|uniref:Uncharacterized protein n=2 Tax=Eucalyptus grandis TaxID=71139 RepID=A0ACC3KP40_EUCGR|nr:hypothetical protein EUGRSUZ_F04262 [Eucalyptus grandis]
MLEALLMRYQIHIDKRQMQNQETLLQIKMITSSCPFSLIDSIFPQIFSSRNRRVFRFILPIERNNKMTLWQEIQE